MKTIIGKFSSSTISDLYRSFSPASRAVLIFAIPFIFVDAIHYYTAGSAIILSFPLLTLIYLLCGGLAAKFAQLDGIEVAKLSSTGRSAGIRLWLTSTIINTLISLVLGFASLGLTVLAGAVYLCLFAPFHALGSALLGWFGGWLYQQVTQRTASSSSFPEGEVRGIQD